MFDRMRRFMTGKYGIDEFSKFLAILAFAIAVIEIFIPYSIVRSMLSLIVVLLIVYTYLRIFSRDFHKRRVENERYLKAYNSFISVFKREKMKFSCRKTHKIFTCPYCKQSIRVPKNKGKIAIICPKCKGEFIKRT